MCACAVLDLQPARLCDGIVSGSPMFLRDAWAHISPHARRLICAMLEKDPSQRITAAGAAAHEWFAAVLSAEAGACSERAMEPAKPAMAIG